MSDPKNVTALGKVLMFDSISQIKAAGLFVDSDGASWSGVFYCQRDKCIAFKNDMCRMMRK